MGLREELDRLLKDGSAAHKRLIDYVVRQVRTGRRLRDVLEDPYVVNRSRALDRRALLEEPEVIDAAGGEVTDDLRAALEAPL